MVGFEAHAHLELLSPEPRERARDRRSVSSNLKQGPCGQEPNRRTNRVSVLEPGETIRVSFVEYINHTSYYRVAFDPDGDDDLPVFGGRGILREGDDPEGNCPVDGRVVLAYDFDDRNQGTHELSVTLPDVECDNCTLQVVQFMYGSPRPYYFQCADLVLRRRGAGADAGDAMTRSAELVRDAGSDAGRAGDASVEPAPVGSDDGSGPPPDFGNFVAPATCWRELPVASADGDTPGSDEPGTESNVDDGASVATSSDEAIAPATGARHGGSGCSIRGARRESAPGTLAWLAFGALALALSRRRGRRGHPQLTRPRSQATRLT
jgi:hypothetical protein